MGDWRIFSYYRSNERITLVRNAGASMNIKHKFFYILRVSEELGLETRLRSENVRFYNILLYMFLNLYFVSKLLLIKIYLAPNIFLYITTRIQSLTFLPSVGLNLSKSMQLHGVSQFGDFQKGWLYCRLYIKYYFYANSYFVLSAL
jgi:hypothetical protein